MEMRFSDSRPQAHGDLSRGLRPLGWTELCARLVAAHDTRGVLAGAAPGSGIGLVMAQGACFDRDAEGPNAGKGFSFHESAAALLRSVEMDVERFVNPASSANGNDTEGTRAGPLEVSFQRRPDEN